MSKIKTRMAELKEDNDLRQKDIADKLGVERSTYAMWEISKSDFPILTANKLAKIDFDLMRKRLKMIRKNKKINQTNLGKKVGFPQGTYSNYEVGSRIPTTFKLMYIAKYYNVSYDYLVGRSDIKEIK